MTYEQGRRRGNAVVDRHALRMALKFSGRSQAEVARRAGIAPSTISNLLGARKTCSVDTAARVAKALDCQASDLFALTMFTGHSPLNSAA